MNQLIGPLTQKKTLKFDMDQLLPDTEQAVYKFIKQCPDLNKIQIWSSLVKLEDVDELLQSAQPDDANLIHASL